MNKPFRRTVLLQWTVGLLAAATLNVRAAQAVDSRGVQFIGFHRFSSFEQSRINAAGEAVLLSPEINTRVSWDQLVASWNADMRSEGWLKVEARAFYTTHATKFYVLGLWSANPTHHPRESVRDQKDDDGDVSTDTLILKQPCDRVQIRITLAADNRDIPELKFFGLSLLDSTAKPGVLPPNQAAWERLIPVPEKSQMAYPNGNVLCSPTTVSMILSYWSEKLKRPELNHDVPEIVNAIYDSKWQGTGNWPFNTAYAGSFRGMRGYVVRLTDVSELEDWVARGVPIGLSLCYNRLRGRDGPPSGHLIVCVGFTEQGDVIVNDPGTSKNIRKTFPRRNLINAWAYSHNAAYLIYPEDADIPTDRFGHWDSWTAHQRISFQR